MKKVIINADDYGISIETSKDIVQMMNDSVCDTTTAMVNMDHYQDCYTIAEENGLTDRVGLHLNLSEGKPITDNIAQSSIFCNSAGEFDGRYKKNIKKRMNLSNGEKELVENEFRAQFERYLNLGYTSMHVDSHQGIHMDPSLYNIVITLAKVYGFKRIRRSPNLKPLNRRTLTRKVLHVPFDMKLNLSELYHFDYLGNAKDFLVSMDSIPDGKTIEIMCHPKEIEGQMYIDHCSNFLLSDYKQMLIQIDHWNRKE